MRLLKYIGFFYFFFLIFNFNFLIFRDEIEKRLHKYKDDYYKEQDFGTFGYFFYILNKIKYYF